MNEIISIDESNVVALIKAQRNGVDIDKPFSRQIYLLSATVAGTAYINNIEELTDNITIGAKLRLIREPDNNFDELAILVKDQQGNKLGYVPRSDNPILARLMDAGKLIYGIVKFIKCPDCNFLNFKMEIYMDD